MSVKKRIERAVDRLSISVLNNMTEEELLQLAEKLQTAEDAVLRMVRLKKKSRIYGDGEGVTEWDHK